MPEKTCENCKHFDKDYTGNRSLKVGLCGNREVVDFVPAAKGLLQRAVRKDL